MTATGAPRDFTVRLIELLTAASIEIPAKPALVETLRGAFDPGTEVFVNLPPNGDTGAVVATAVALRRAGFHPVAHVAARNLASAAELGNYLSRLVGDAGADRALLIAGDRRPSAGPLASVADLMATGRIEASGLGAVGFAGHPEGLPFAEPTALSQALVAKCAGARKAGLAPFIVTQFCFEARPILDFLAELDRLGIEAPVRVGVAAPASLATLVKFAVRCGVGNSLRTLRAQPKTVGRLIGEAGPEDVLHDLAVGLALVPRDRVTGIHFYAFGGVAKAAEWIEMTLARLYSAISRTASG
ncbi:MAG: methylenetetrahydrofolate reductase [Bauldia sp.]